MIEEVVRIGTRDSVPVNRVPQWLVESYYPRGNKVATVAVR